MGLKSRATPIGPNKIKNKHPPIPNSATIPLAIFATKETIKSIIPINISSINEISCVNKYKAFPTIFFNTFILPLITSDYNSLNKDITPFKDFLQLF